MLFCISNTFKQRQAEIGKNQADFKQHPESELLIFENYSHFSSRNRWTYSKKKQKKQVCLYSWDYAINHNVNEDENEKKII